MASNGSQGKGGGSWISIAVVALVVIAIAIWTLSGGDDPAPRSPDFMGQTAGSEESPPGTVAEDSGVTKPSPAAPTRAAGDALRRTEEEAGSQAAVPRIPSRETRGAIEPSDGTIAALEREFEMQLPPPEELERIRREGEYLPPQEELDRLLAEQEAVPEPSPEEIERMRREAEEEPSPEQLEELYRRAEAEKEYFGD